MDKKNTNTTEDSSRKKDSVLIPKIYTAEERSRMDMTLATLGPALLQVTPASNREEEELLKLAKAKRLQSWEVLENKIENNETIIGVVSGKVRGGFSVNLGDIRGFLPGSLIGIHREIEGRELEFKLIKVIREKNSVVVSCRAVIDEKKQENYISFHQKINKIFDSEFVNQEISHEKYMIDFKEKIASISEGVQ